MGVRQVAHRPCYDVGLWIDPNGVSAQSGTACYRQSLTPLCPGDDTNANHHISGQQATYRLEVGNAGTTATIGALTVLDPMPLGLIVVSVKAPSGWDCSASTAQLVRCTYPYALQPQAATHSILVVVEVVPNAPSPIMNIATVSAEDPSPNPTNVDPTNDTDSLSTPVLPPPAPAPALSPFALAAALLLLLFIARRRMRPLDR